MSARNLEDIEPRYVITYNGAICEWLFSATFWEVVLVNQDHLSLAEWGATDPEPIAGYAVVWRRVRETRNRRWALAASGGAPPRAVSRVGIRAD
jgi:hypothetical protein